MSRARIRSTGTGRRAAGAAASRRRRGALAVVCLAALGVGGCASIPRSGPVHVVEAPPTESASAQQDPSVSGPAQDATPEQVVRDFLAAGQGLDDDYAAARQFLAPELAATWRPSARTMVFSGAAGIQQGLAEDQVRVSVDARAIIDSRGIMTRQEAGSSEELDLELEQIDGQWRISSAPDGILVPSSNLDELYQPRNLYFLDPGGEYAVPDPRWFPDRQGTSTQLMRALLEGPAPYLEGAVETAYPDSAALAEGTVVPIQDGTAEVDLEMPGSEPGDLQSNEDMYAQAMLTLGGLPDVEDVELVLDGTPLDLGPLAESDLPARNVVVPSRQIALRDEQLVFHQGGQESPVPEVSESLSGLSPSDPAMDRGADSFAALTRDGTAAVTFTAEAPEPVERFSGEGLTAPSLDPQGWAWAVDGTGLVRAAPTDPQQTEVTEVEATWLEGTAVSSLRISRGGTRALIVTDEGDDSRILVAGVVRGTDGEPQRLNDPYAVDTGGGEIMADAAWISDSEFVASARTDSATAPRIYEISGRNRSLPIVETGVQHLSGGNGDGEVFIESDGELRLLTGESWSPQTDDISDAAFTG